MCGIVGYIDSRGSSSVDLVTRMARAIEHRGPDDFGGWADTETGVALGHRRLSILDLSPEGHQPKASNSGRFMMTFNGEIYNYADLKAELIKLGHSFKGTSDTEVMLCAFEAWGVEESLRRFVGMFSFGVLDRSNRTVHIARDRIGEKPMYYGWAGGVFLFGSELKAFKVHPAFQGEINRDSITQLLRHGYIPAPHSIYNGIYKLPPATFLRLAVGEVRNGAGSFSEFPEGDARIKPQYYWSLDAVAGPSNLGTFKGSDAQALVELERLLSQAVGLQMVADVPLGAFLSGGIDSSTIVALMQKQSTRPIKTFSIGFEEQQYNEAQFAKEVAKHLKTDHTELYITSKQTLDVVPLLPQIYCEPFGDSSQIPTYLVSKLARTAVTVSLSGDAGDELFGGYSRYIWCQKLWDYVRIAPQFLRSGFSTAVQAIPGSTWNKIFSVVRPALPKSLSFSDLGYKFQRAAGRFSASSADDLYYQLFSTWEDAARVVINGKEPRTLHTSPELWPKGVNFYEHMMWLDTATYLPDDILVKVDRAAMAVSLETRVPLLDHRVVEFVWSLPVSMRIRGDTTKWLLRELLYKYVPRQMVDRPKMGFGAPINAWLRGPLRDWAESLLDESRLRNEGYLNPKLIRTKWQEHQSGVRDWQYPLWHTLMFQAWREHNAKTVALAA